MDLMEILNWIIGSGGSIMIASWIFERMSWFQSLESKVKEIIFFCLSTVFAIGAYLILQFVPVDIIEMISPYFGIVVSVFTTVFIGEGFHRVDKAD